MNTNDTLQHFGVKGMKWGIRRSTRNKIKKAAKIAGGVAIGAAAAYGTYKLYKHFNTKGSSLKKVASTISKSSNNTKQILGRTDGKLNSMLKNTSKNISKKSSGKMTKLSLDKVDNSLKSIDKDITGLVSKKKKVSNDILARHAKLRNQVKNMNNGKDSLNNKLSVIAKNNNVLNNKALSQRNRIDNTMKEVNELFKDLMK